MSSRFLAASFVLIALAGCDRETRESRGKPLPETDPVVETSALFAGTPDLLPPDPRARIYEANAFHIGEGQRLYEWMNCVGCHAHGGGGMGPPLMDDQWIYGDRMEQIVQTIVQGRPNGMPSYGGKLTEQQAWQLAAFVRAMAHEVPKARRQPAATRWRTPCRSLSDRRMRRRPARRQERRGGDFRQRASPARARQLAYLVRLGRPPVDNGRRRALIGHLPLHHRHRHFLRSGAHAPCNRTPTRQRPAS